MTQLEVSKLVAMLMACYPGVRFPEGTVVAYETFLLELDHERARKAVAALVRTSKFMPTIAEVVTAYEGQVAGGSEAPYHRLFRPRRDGGSVMAPGELKQAVDEFLSGAKRRSGGES